MSLFMYFNRAPRTSKIDSTLQNERLFSNNDDELGVFGQIHAWDLFIKLTLRIVIDLNVLKSPDCRLKFNFHRLLKFVSVIFAAYN